MIICFDDMFMQGLTIIAFHHGDINLNTFKVVLSTGPAFFILNFLESMLLYSCMYSCSFLSTEPYGNDVLLISFSIPWIFFHFNWNLCFCCRLFGCSTHVWGLQHSKRFCNLKIDYQVFLVWSQFNIYDISLLVSLDFVMLLLIFRFLNIAYQCVQFNKFKYKYTNYFVFKLISN